LQSQLAATEIPSDIQASDQPERSEEEQVSDNPKSVTVTCSSGGPTYTQTINYACFQTGDSTIKEFRQAQDCKGFSITVKYSDKTYSVTPTPLQGPSLENCSVPTRPVCANGSLAFQSTNNDKCIYNNEEEANDPEATKKAEELAEQLRNLESQDDRSKALSELSLNEDARDQVLSSLSRADSLERMAEDASTKIAENEKTIADLGGEQCLLSTTCGNKIIIEDTLRKNELLENSRQTFQNALETIRNEQVRLLASAVPRDTSSNTFTGNQVEGYTPPTGGSTFQTGSGLTGNPESQPSTRPGANQPPAQSGPSFLSSITSGLKSVGNTVSSAAKYVQDTVAPAIANTYKSAIAQVQSLPQTLSSTFGDFAGQGTNFRAAQDVGIDTGTSPIVDPIIQANELAAQNYDGGNITRYCEAAGGVDCGPDGEDRKKLVDLAEYTDEYEPSARGNTELLNRLRTIAEQGPPVDLTEGESPSVTYDENGIPTPRSRPDSSELQTESEVVAVNPPDQPRSNFAGPGNFRYAQDANIQVDSEAPLTPSELEKFPENYREAVQKQCELGRCSLMHRIAALEDTPEERAKQVTQVALIGAPNCSRVSIQDCFQASSLPYTLEGRKQVCGDLGLDYCDTVGTAKTNILMANDVKKFSLTGTETTVTSQQVVTIDPRGAVLQVDEPVETGRSEKITNAPSFAENATLEQLREFYDQSQSVKEGTQTVYKVVGDICGVVGISSTDQSCSAYRNKLSENSGVLKINELPGYTREQLPEAAKGAKLEPWSPTAITETTNTVAKTVGSDVETGGTLPPAQKYTTPGAYLGSLFETARGQVTETAKGFGNAVGAAADRVQGAISDVGSFFSARGPEISDAVYVATSPQMKEMEQILANDFGYTPEQTQEYLNNVGKLALQEKTREGMDAQLQLNYEDLYSSSIRDTGRAFLESPELAVSRAQENYLTKSPKIQNVRDALAAAGKTPTEVSNYVDKLIQLGTQESRTPTEADAYLDYNYGKLLAYNKELDAARQAQLDREITFEQVASLPDPSTKIEWPKQPQQVAKPWYETLFGFEDESPAGAQFPDAADTSLPGRFDDAITGSSVPVPDTTELLQASSVLTDKNVQRGVRAFESEMLVQNTYEEARANALSWIDYAKDPLNANVLGSEVAQDLISDNEKRLAEIEKNYAAYRAGNPNSDVQTAVQRFIDDDTEGGRFWEALDSVAKGAERDRAGIESSLEANKEDPGSSILLGTAWLSGQAVGGAASGLQGLLERTGDVGFRPDAETQLVDAIDPQGIEFRLLGDATQAAGVVPAGAIVKAAAKTTSLGFTGVRALVAPGYAPKFVPTTKITPSFSGPVEPRFTEPSSFGRTITPDMNAFERAIIPEGPSVYINPVDDLTDTINIGRIEDIAQFTRAPFTPTVSTRNYSPLLTNNPTVNARVRSIFNFTTPEPVTPLDPAVVQRVNAMFGRSPAPTIVPVSVNKSGSFDSAAWASVFEADISAVSPANSNFLTPIAPSPELFAPINPAAIQRLNSFRPQLPTAAE